MGNDDVEPTNDASSTGQRLSLQEWQSDPIMEKKNSFVLEMVDDYPKWLKQHLPQVEIRLPEKTTKDMDFLDLFVGSPRIQQVWFKISWLRVHAHSLLPDEIEIAKKLDNFSEENDGFLAFNVRDPSAYALLKELTTQQVERLAGSTEEDPKLEEPGGGSLHASEGDVLAKWQAKYEEAKGVNQITRQLAKAYPTWLRELDDEISFVPGRNPGELEIRLHGERLQYLAFNTSKSRNLYVLLYEPAPDDLDLLRDRLLSPSSLRNWKDQKIGNRILRQSRFFVNNDHDYDLLKEIAKRQVARVRGKMVPGDGAAGKTEPDELKEKFEHYRQDPFFRLITKMRQSRAAQIRELLAEPGKVTLEQFEREVWLHTSSVTLDGQPIKLTEKTKQSNEESEGLEKAYEEGRFEVHGNYVWGEPGPRYDPHLHDLEQKQSNLRESLTILADDTLGLLDQIKDIDEVSGFGESIASGLVMLKHPDEIEIFNEESRQALRDLGYEFSNIEEFEQDAQELKKRLGAQDFLELDLFLYSLNHKQGDKKTITAPRYWWVFQGQNYEKERDGGYVSAGKGSRKLAHHMNVGRLKVGDMLLHCVAGSLRAVGRVTEDGKENANAYTAKVEYHELKPAISVKSIPEEFRRYWPGGPFDRAGAPNEGYLFSLTTEFADGFTGKFWEHLPVVWPKKGVKGNVWMFQANPKYLDLPEELKGVHAGDHDNWTITSYWNEMETGDVVVLWLAGAQAGVYATGELTSNPYLHTYEVDEAPWVKPGADGKKTAHRVDFRYTRILENPILKAKILKDPVLKNMGVIKFANSTNFKVTGDEWDALQLLLDGTVDPDDRWIEPIVKHVTFEEIWQALRAQGLYYSREVLANYLLALQTKRFVILTGISGTGKTRLAQAVAGYLSDQVSGQGYEDGAEKSYRVVAVRPDWTDNRGLLGYYNPIIEEYTRTPFLDLLLEARGDADVAAMRGWEPRAFFIVLDEMNLARVEHYFSDFLSVMESDEEIALYDEARVSDYGEIDNEGVPSRLRIPKNIFFTGTVNVDETTYMFSPKVLDRAFTIELNEVNLEGWGRHEVDGLEGEVADDTVNLVKFPGTLKFERKPSFEDWVAFGKLLNGELQSVVVGLNKLLGEKNRHFGYRSAGEIARFVRLASEQTEGEGRLWAALDLAILQKVLPKLSGTQQELEEVLTSLLSFATSANTTIDDESVEEKKPRLPRTAGKVGRMLQRLREQGFTAFIE